MASNLQVNNANALNIQARVLNPYGEYNIEPLKNYQPQNFYNGNELEDENYHAIQNAEASYYMGANLINHSESQKSINSYNRMARMLGYNNVSTLHRHDVN